MSTTTTAKKAMPLGTNGLSSQSMRSHSSDSNKRVGNEFDLKLKLISSSSSRLVNFGGHLNEMKLKFVLIMIILIKMYHQK
jgi:hypothetical protein